MPQTDPAATEREESSLSRLFEEHAAVRLRSLLEAVLFASPEPVTLRQLAQALREPEEHLQRLIDDLAASYEKPEHGVFIRSVRGGYQMAAKPEHHEDLKELLRGLRPRAPLSLPALQILAIIAYKQPVSAPEIQAIRRVEGAGVLQTLLKRRLIAPAGYKDDGGHALLYKTTRQFLIDFGLKDLKELPALEEFAGTSGALRTEPLAADRRPHRLTRLPRPPSPKALMRSHPCLHARTLAAATFR
jgi:segregation and condensation protein B